MTSHFVEIFAAVILAALPGTAVARVFPPHSDCTTYTGNSRISCNKQMGSLQRSGATAREPSAASAPANRGGAAMGAAASGGRQTSAQDGRTTH